MRVGIVVGRTELLAFAFEVQTLRFTKLPCPNTGGISESTCYTRKNRAKNLERSIVAARVRMRASHVTDRVRRCRRFAAKRGAACWSPDEHREQTLVRDRPDWKHAAL